MKDLQTDPNLRITLEPVTAPANPPLLLADVKSHLRVTTDAEDSFILSLMEVVRATIDGRDGWLGRALITQTWDCWLDWNFPAECTPIEIPLAPLQAVTYIHYTDLDGNAAVVDPSVYTVDTKSDRSRILPAYSKFWPAVRYVTNAIQIRGVFGYGATPNSIPEPIKHAMKLMVGHLYENREQTTMLNIAELKFGVASLLDPYRVRRF